MTGKILICEQNYDVVEYHHLLNKEDLDDYIKEWVEKYIKRYENIIKTDYISHEIDWEHSNVNIKIHQHECIINGMPYSAKTFMTFLQFIDLEKMPLWGKK